MKKLLPDLILYTAKGTILYLGDLSSTTVIYIYIYIHTLVLYIQEYNQRYIFLTAHKLLIYKIISKSLIWQITTN